MKALRVPDFCDCLGTQSGWVHHCMLATVLVGPADFLSLSCTLGGKVLDLAGSCIALFSVRQIHLAG
jgi:hypothetical protein